MSLSQSLIIYVAVVIYFISLLVIYSTCSVIHLLYTDNLVFKRKLVKGYLLLFLAFFLFSYKFIFSTWCHFLLSERHHFILFYFICNVSMLLKILLCLTNLEISLFHIHLLNTFVFRINNPILIGSSFLHLNMSLHFLRLSIIYDER